MTNPFFQVGRRGAYGSIMVLPVYIIIDQWYSTPFDPGFNPESIFFEPFKNIQKIHLRFFSPFRQQFCILFRRRPRPRGRIFYTTFFLFSTTFYILSSLVLLGVPLHVFIKTRGDGGQLFPHINSQNLMSITQKYLSFFL